MEINQLLKSVRQYFWAKNFTEVEIPYLNESLPLEPNLYAFKTKWVHKNRDYFLPTSPEFALKKHLAKHQQNCFAISHCFRDLEDSNDTHTPEFLMLEWYEMNKNLIDLQKSVQDFISQFLNLKFEILNLPIDVPQNEPDFNQYFLNEIEPNLPKDSGVFITGYPAFLSPHAKPKKEFLESSKSAFGGNAQHLTEEKNSFTTANRFELYINGIEIANGCEENTNSDSIKNAFKKEQKYRLDNNLPTHPYSSEFIKNSSNLPPCSGVGLGIDRLLSIIESYEQTASQKHTSKRTVDQTLDS